MRFLRFVWKLFIMASVFGIGYIIGREHSFEEEEMWEEEAEKLDKPESGPTASGEESEVDFELEDAEATKVSIVGTFNNWDKNANPMKKENGVWKCTLKLKPGKHEYQFVVNETDWILDPKSGNNVNNKYEGKNSIIEVG
ncbi:MAG: isoamylase early set domain-containing protein [Candidatus Rifleibacteriota bacterium]